MRVRIPRGQLVTISADLQRAAAALVNLEQRLSLAMGLIRGGSNGGAEPRLGQTEEQLVEAYAHGRQLADQATALASCLRDAVDILDTADRRAAGRVPSVPRLVGALPILRPDPRPWPYAAVPAVTMLQVERRAVGGAPDAADSREDDDLVSGGHE